MLLDLLLLAVAKPSQEWLAWRPVSPRRRNKQKTVNEGLLGAAGGGDGDEWGEELAPLLV